MPGNFSIRICITTSEITDACIKAVEAVATNTNSPGCLLICKMDILSTGTVRRIRFRHYGLPLIIQRCFGPECIIARNVANIKTFYVVRRNMRLHGFLCWIKKRFEAFRSSVQLHILKQKLLFIAILHKLTFRKKKKKIKKKNRSLSSTFRNSVSYAMIYCPEFSLKKREHFAVLPQRFNRCTRDVVSSNELRLLFVTGDE